MGLVNDVKESIESFFNRKDKIVILRDVHGDFTQIGYGISFSAPHVKNGFSVNKQLQITRDLQRAALNGDVDEVKRLIPVSDPKADDSYALSIAAMNGHLECVKALIPVSDPKADESEALKLAAERGHADCVELLIPVSDPKADESGAMRRAAGRGHAHCVKLLIPVSDPKADDCNALQWAAENGHVVCVKLLIPVSDPKADDSWALRGAAMYGHTECVKLLIPVSGDPITLRECLYDDEEALKTLDQAEAELVLEQRERLTNVIGTNMEDAPVKKRRM
ncbi:ankyrin repeat domain-containing protein [Stenotrophomonas acidaminiphila]